MLFSIAKQLAVVDFAVAPPTRGGSQFGKDGRHEVAVVDRLGLRQRLAVHALDGIAPLNVFGGVRGLQLRHERVDRLHRVVDGPGLGHVVAVLLGQLVEFGGTHQGSQMEAGAFVVDHGQVIDSIFVLVFVVVGNGRQA